MDHYNFQNAIQSAQNILKAIVTSPSLSKKTTYSEFSDLNLKNDTAF